MKTTILIAALILVIVPAMVLGSPWNGGSNGNWENEPNETLNGTITLKVYQWCDIELQQSNTPNLEVYDYDESWDATVTGDPNTPYVAALMDVRSNADLNLAMVGFDITKITANGATDVTVECSNYILNKQWTLWRWHPQPSTSVVYDPSDPDASWKDIFDDENSIINDMFTLDKEHNCLEYNDNVWANFGIGLRINVSRNFPAGKYELKFYIYVFPTVTFPSG